MRFIFLIAVLFASSNSYSQSACSDFFEKQPLQHNILLQKSKLENGMYPEFDKVKDSDFLPAFEALTAQAKEKVEAIKKIQKPTFNNIILAMEEISQSQQKTYGVFSTYAYTAKTPDIQKIEETKSELMTNLSNEIYTDPILAKQIERVRNENSQLKSDQKRLVDEYFDAFKDNGLYLQDDKREIFKKNKLELAELYNRYSNNVREDSGEFSLNITDESQLAGLSDIVKKTLHENAIANGKEGFLIKLGGSLYLDIQKNADNPELRKVIFEAWSLRANNNNQFNNTEVALKIAKLRAEQAHMLGYKNFEEWALRDRLVKNSQNLENFTQELLDVYYPKAVEEEKELKNFVKEKTGSDVLNPWDYTYWAEKMFKEKIGYDPEAVKPYFVYENIEKTLFGLAEKLYGIHFVPRSDLPVPHPDVLVYEVKEKDNKTLAYLLIDRYAREGTKEGGAWAMPIINTYQENGIRIIPVISINMNFMKPSAGNPTLLSVLDTTTLFHEFGHGLHGMLSQARYLSQAGTNVQRDIVELPSQVMENFVYEPEIIKSFGFHYKTHEPIPDELIHKIIASKQFRAATMGLRQTRFILIDHFWHTGAMESLSGSLSDREAQLVGSYNLTSQISGAALSTAFTHIFSGGYASGYYSYKWAEVYDADTFAIFKNGGYIEPAQRFRKNILEKGGSLDANDAYMGFAGRLPKIDAMLKRDGLK